MSGSQVQSHTEYRRQEVARRYLQGERQESIATFFGVGQSVISRDLTTIRAAWLASAVRDFDALKSEELARIDLVENEAWQAWERSKEDRESTIQEQSNGKLKVSRRIEKHPGDPRWLQAVMQCVDRRCALLGLDAPKRFTIDWETLTDAQMERLARGEPLPNVLADTPPANTVSSTLAEA